MKIFIGVVVSFLMFYIMIFLITHVYSVPESYYAITDQTGEVKLVDYPEIKGIEFMYSTDLLIEFYERIDNLKLEKINLRFNDDIIGTIEINKNINDLENFGQTYIASNGKKVVIRKSYPLQNEFLRILGKNGEVYTPLEGGRLYLDIYIKDLKKNKTFIIKRNNVFFYFERAGFKTFSMWYYSGIE